MFESDVFSQTFRAGKVTGAVFTYMFVFVMMFHMGPQYGPGIKQFPAYFTGNIFTLQMDNISVSLQVRLQVEFSVTILEITVELWFTMDVHVFLQHPDQFESH